jgi:large subunit ribosomal protein L22
MESTTYMKNLRIPPKKLRFYLDQVKKMTPAESLKHLFYGQQRATQVLYKAVKSAVANAERTLKVTADMLNFKVLTIEEGQTLKRYIHGSRGNVKPVKKHMSHIKIVLVGKVEPKNVEIKKEEVKEVKADEKKVVTSKKKTDLKVKETAKKAEAKK